MSINNLLVNKKINLSKKIYYNLKDSFYNIFYQINSVQINSGRDYNINSVLNQHSIMISLPFYNIFLI